MKMPFRDATKSVRFRTTFGAVLALVVLLAIAGSVINWFVGREIQQSFDATLREQASDRVALFDEGAPVESLLTVIGDEALVVAVGPDGTVLAAAGTGTPEDLVGLAPGIHQVTTTVVEQGEGLHREEVRVAVAVASDGARFVVGNEGEESGRAKAAVRNILLGVIPLVACAAAVVAWLVTGRALEPVKAMRRDLGDVAHAGDGRRVTRPGTGDEIDDLGAEINLVLDRLDQASLARRRFVADASHELKSPLANARAIIETADDSAGEVEHERVIVGVGSELNRLHGLVDDLLFLASEDEGAPRSPARFDLADVVFDEAERVAATTTKTIDGSGIVPVEVIADVADISRAIRNLIENAERFATTRVHLSIAEDGDRVRLIVADDGPGVPVEHRTTIFERFTRLDTDRARSAGGTGLGLAIVASIADRNAGSISVLDSADRGAQFELSLPSDYGSVDD